MFQQQPMPRPECVQSCGFVAFCSAAAKLCEQSTRAGQMVGLPGLRATQAQMSGSRFIELVTSVASGLVGTPELNPTALRDLGMQAAIDCRRGPGRMTRLGSNVCRTMTTGRGMPQANLDTLVQLAQIADRPVAPLGLATLLHTPQDFRR
jgi:hypothetical protein